MAFMLKGMTVKRFESQKRHWTLHFCTVLRLLKTMETVEARLNVFYIMIRLAAYEIQGLDAVV